MCKCHYKQCCSPPDQPGNNDQYPTVTASPVSLNCTGLYSVGPHSLITEHKERLVHCLGLGNEPTIHPISARGGGRFHSCSESPIPVIAGLHLMTVAIFLLVSEYCPPPPPNPGHDRVSPCSQGWSCSVGSYHIPLDDYAIFLTSE